MSYLLTIICNILLYAHLINQLSVYRWYANDHQYVWGTREIGDFLIQSVGNLQMQTKDTW
jgi:hypothetical protein